MAKLIKQPEIPIKTFKIGDHISFTIWIPLQNIGQQPKTKMGNIVKVNRKTVDAIDEIGNTWRVGMNEIH
jgi:hypothetical protein